MGYQKVAKIREGAVLQLAKEKLIAGAEDIKNKNMTSVEVVKSLECFQQNHAGHTYGSATVQYELTLE